MKIARLLLQFCFSAVLISGLSGMHQNCARSAEPPQRWKLQPVQQQLSFPELGAGQGVLKHDGKIYLYGDAETGIVLEYVWSPQQPESLEPTGRKIHLTRNGEDIVSHPTGLTIHPIYGAFLGDTVLQKGTIFHIDWERALQQGKLDDAILNMVNDDLAANGTRPEFVAVEDRWFIATSDYGDTVNELRLYDPERLKQVTRTSAPGVLVHRQQGRPFVQTLEYVPEWQSLVMVQNQIAGLKYRLTFIQFGRLLEAELSQPYDLTFPVDELEGWTYLGNGWVLYLSSSRKNNVSLGKLEMSGE